jgi:hypothetical protein
MKKNFLIWIVILGSTIAYGQTGATNWIVGKWKCIGDTYTADYNINFPDSINKFNESCGVKYYFKKNGTGISKWITPNGKHCGRSKYKWKLNNTNDTLYFYNRYNKIPIKIPIKKYSQNMFAMNNPGLNEERPYQLFKRE